MMAGALYDDASSLFMDDLFPLKEEDTFEAAASSTTATTETTTMDDMFPTSSLELVQLLAYDDVDDDMFMDGAFAMSTAPSAVMLSDDVYYSSPTASDDLSDAMTDVASEMSSPPPCYEDDRHHTPTSPVTPSAYLSPQPVQASNHTHNFNYTSSSGQAAAGGGVAVQTATSKPKHQSPTSPATPLAPPQMITTSTPTVAFPNTAKLPFAFPVACFPPMNLNQKRPLPDVLPNTPAAVDATSSKKSKREIRQMKNRESANRSRLRRKAQLSDLSGEVDELLKKQHELQNTIAALQAENKSLHDQNSFLRSLVTMGRGVVLPPVPSSAASTASASFTPQPLPSRPAMAMQTSPMSDLESGHRRPGGDYENDEDNEDDDDEDDDEEEEDQVVMRVPTAKKRKAISRSAATLSATGLGLCASVFGLTILTDSDHGAAQSSHIRRSGRVLHSLPATAAGASAAANLGCTPGPILSMLERLWEMLSSSYVMLSTSELAYGVFLNVLSFVVIMGLYHCSQQWSFDHDEQQQQQSATKQSFRWESLKHNSKRAAANAKRRSVSWQDVRLETAAHDDASKTNSSTPRVQVVFS